MRVEGICEESACLLPLILVLVILILRFTRRCRVANEFEALVEAWNVEKASLSRHLFRTE